MDSGRSLAEEPPPEVTTIRFEKDPVTCIAPQVVEALLRAEGFTDIRYVELTEAYLRKSPASLLPPCLCATRLILCEILRPPHVLLMDADAPITLLTGLHRCFVRQRGHPPDSGSEGSERGRALWGRGAAAYYGQPGWTRSRA